MKNKTEFLTSLIPLLLLSLVQAFYVFAPTQIAAAFISIRPVFILAIIIIYLIFKKKVERPVLQRQRANLIAAFIVIFYFAAVLILGIIFGFGTTISNYSLRYFLNTFWGFGISLLALEFLRFQLIKEVSLKQRYLLSVIITITYTFLQLDGFRGFLRSGNIAEFWFLSIIPALILNAVLTYIAYDGSLAALLAIRAIYSLPPLLMPYMPRLSKEVWVLVTIALLIVTLFFYRYNMNIRIGRLWRMRKLYKKSKHRSVSKSGWLLLFAITAVLILFILRAFTYFPIVILTGSMTGTIDKNSVVFVEKVPPRDVYNRIQEGDVIVFEYRNAEVMHRVIEVRENALGERVYITKGDANEKADFYPVEEEQVIGIATAYIPYIGYPVVLLKSIL